MDAATDDLDARAAAVLRRLAMLSDDGGLAMVFGRPGAQVAIVPGP